MVLVFGILHFFRCGFFWVTTIVVLSSADSCRNIYIYIYIYTLETYRRNDKDRRRKTSLIKYLPLTLLQGSEKVIQGLRLRGSWRPNRTEIFWPPLLLFSWCSTRGPGVHSAGWWLSLLHIISNFSGPKTPSGFPRDPSAGCGFPYHNSSITPSPTVTGTVTNWLLSWLSYIIVQLPLDRPLDLWNGMINRHPAEIIVQFRGHSLPVRQSMRVSWDFLGCPILLANFRPRDFLS